MTTKPLDTIILLCPSGIQGMKELRTSLEEFCKKNHIAIVDIINFADEYDHFAMRRLSQIIKYRTKPVTLVTNKNVLTIIPNLILWASLEGISSSNIADKALDFMRELMKSIKTPNYQNDNDFHMVQAKEVGGISDWIRDMHNIVF